MKEKIYKEEIDKVKASKKFKLDTIKLMKIEIEKNKKTNENFEENSNENYKSKHMINAYKTNEENSDIDRNNLTNIKKIKNVNENRNKNTNNFVNIINKKKRNKVKYYKIFASVAVSIIVISAIVINKKKDYFFSLEQSKEIIDEKELPRLTINSTIEIDGMGYEAEIAKDIKEIKNGNPWSVNEKIDRLPVYKNKAFTDIKNRGAMESPLSREEMIDKSEGIAKALGFEITGRDIGASEDEINELRKKLEIVGEVLNEEISIPKIITEESTIETDVASRTTVTFNNPIEIFNDIKNIESEKILEKLSNEYSKKLNIKKPIENLEVFTNIYGEQNYRYKIYEGEGNIKNKIIAYNFKFVEFVLDEDLKLSSIHVENKDLSEKLGDYKIITVEEAQELLLDGKYVTTVDYKIKDKETVKKVELIYRKSDYDNLLIPYYRFLVQLPAEGGSIIEENNLKEYGAYYVPAIESSYYGEIKIESIEFN
ncbi:MAG: hypothetical protein ACRDD2_00860 [Sarcina sp.]